MVASGHMGMDYDKPLYQRSLWNNQWEIFRVFFCGHRWNNHFWSIFGIVASRATPGAMWVVYPWLGGETSSICLFSPQSLGKWFSIWRACFSNGWLKPPTRWLLHFFLYLTPCKPLVNQRVFPQFFEGPYMELDSAWKPAPMASTPVNKKPGNVKNPRPFWMIWT